jgi:hypothetical protein
VHEVCEHTCSKALHKIFEVRNCSTHVASDYYRDAADEVMNQYRNTLDKINGARDKTEYNIDRIKTLMTRAEGNTQKIEGIVR